MNMTALGPLSRDAELHAPTTSLRLPRNKGFDLM